MPASIERFFQNLSMSAQVSKRRSICEWRTNRSELEHGVADPKLANTKYDRHPGIATVLSIDREHEILAWISLLHKDGVPVSSFMLQHKALDVVKEAEVTPLSASWHWQKGFLRRHRMSALARSRSRSMKPTP
jgi:hypothetical protein